MKDKTREQLLNELDTLREQIAELRRAEAEHELTEEALQKAHDELGLRMEERTRQLRLLQEINNNINVGMPLKEVLQMATEGVREIFDYTACDIFLLEKGKRSLILAALSVDSGIIKQIEKLTGLTVLGYRVPLFEGSHFTEVVDNKKICTIDDPVKVFKDFTDNKKLKLLAGQAARIAGFKSSIVAPLIAEDEVIGAIGAARKGKIARGDAEVLGQFASQMALAIRNKQTEEALLESEGRYRGLVESAKDVIFTVSTDGTITSLNPAFETITDWPRAEWVGKQFSPIIHPDDLPLAMKRFQNTLQGKTVPMAELRVKVKSGEYLIGEFKTTPQIQNGKTVGMLGIVRDITERKRAEEEMKKRLMMFRLEDGNVYLVKEPTPDLSLRAFNDILKVGYRGLAISRTPEEKFKKTIGGSFEFSWLAESGVENALPPKLKQIELKIENLPQKNTVLIDRLDYLIFKEGFEKTLSFVQHMGEVAYLAGLVVILSIDPSTLDKRELRLLEKETLEVEPRNKARLPEDLLEILRFIYGQNTRGIKPSYTDIGEELRVSKPTVRRRIRSLISTGYAIESKRGMYKVVELTDKGRNLFFK